MRKNFKVPVYAYLLKYCRKQFFAGQSQPYKIEEDTLIGKQFMSVLMDVRKKEMMGDQLLLQTETLDVELSEAMAKRSPNLGKLAPLNFFLDKLFKDALIMWIKSAEHHGIKPYPSSKAFLEHFGIDEHEYSHDAAYKHWTRYKNEGFQKVKKMRQARAKTGVGVAS